MADWKDRSINLAEVNSERLLKQWNWLLGTKPFRPIALTLFGDWFLEDEAGRICFLDLISGSIAPAAVNEAEFTKGAQIPGKLDERFMPDLVELLRERGVGLRRGLCYGYRLPPVVGGKLELENIEPTDLMIHESIMSQIHEQTRRLPPGTKISRFPDEGEEP